MEIKDQEVIRLLSELFLQKLETPDWAIKVLEQGFDSKSLRMLASMTTFDSPVEKDGLVKRSIEELGWEVVDFPECLLSYSRVIAKDIVDKHIEPVDGAEIIYSILVKLDYPSELDGWNMIDESVWGYRH